MGYKKGRIPAWQKPATYKWVFITFLQLSARLTDPSPFRQPLSAYSSRKVSHVSPISACLKDYYSDMIHRIKCDRCRKWKGTTNYSKKQLDELRKKLSKLRSAEIPDAMTANCRACNGGSVVELQCSKCDKVKGLDDFAKAQRSNGDNAVSIILHLVYPDGH